MTAERETHRSEELIKIRTVLQMVALSRTAVYAGMKEGTFPQQKQVGLRSVAWLRSEIEKWIATRPGKKNLTPAQELRPGVGSVDSNS